MAQRMREAKWGLSREQEIGMNTKFTVGRLIKAIQQLPSDRHIPSPDVMTTRRGTLAWLASRVSRTGGLWARTWSAKARREVRL